MTLLSPSTRTGKHRPENLNPPYMATDLIADIREEDTFVHMLTSTMHEGA